MFLILVLRRRDGSGISPGLATCWQDSRDPEVIILAVSLLRRRNKANSGRVEQPQVNQAQYPTALHQSSHTAPRIPAPAATTAEMQILQASSSETQHQSHRPTESLRGSTVHHQSELACKGTVSRPHRSVKVCVSTGTVHHPRCPKPQTNGTRRLSERAGVSVSGVTLLHPA